MSEDPRDYKAVWAVTWMMIVVLAAIMWRSYLS